MTYTSHPPRRDHPKHLAKRTIYEAPHYVVFSILRQFLLLRFKYSPQHLVLNPESIRMYDLRFPRRPNSIILSGDQPCKISMSQENLIKPSIHILASFSVRVKVSHP